MRAFQQMLGITGETRVLDVGGTPLNWSLAPVKPRLTILNMPRAGEEIQGVQWVAGDGRRLPFRDKSFDVVFSNSVIEHLGDAASQREFAREVARVGARYYVQTPNRWFPLETHLLTPFVHFLPKRWQQRIVPRFSVWDLITRATADRRAYYLDHYLSDVRLLGYQEMRELFPRAEIVRERFLGLTKSLIAVLR
jgi:SAM-dependent methyltransferase